MSEQDRHSKTTNTRIAVLGGGESGVGAALLALKRGYPVFLSDYGRIKPPFRKELEKAGIEFEEGGHDEARILSSDIVVKSPGIPEKADIIKAVRGKHIELISEIEWAFRFIDGTVVAITGSNGKTTTTSLIWHILNKDGRDAALAGNIGKSLARTVSEKSYEYYVVEVSSFQLDDIVTFRPHISVITNITEDHLDRYDYRFENYIRSKLRIAENQGPEDYCIYCLDDAVSASYIKELGNTACIPFSWEHSVSEGAYRAGDNINFQLKKNTSPCQ